MNTSFLGALRLAERVFPLPRHVCADNGDSTVVLTRRPASTRK
jgi:hypothetical protein